MWSIGAITYVMLTGEMPFQGQDAKETMEAVKKGFVKTNNPGFKSLSPEAQNFIISLMNKNEMKRMTAVQALEHPWILKNTQEQKSPVFLK
jgi:serine/threonine protein kinase